MGGPAVPCSSVEHDLQYAECESVCTDDAEGSVYDEESEPLFSPVTAISSSARQRLSSPPADLTGAWCKVGKEEGVTSGQDTFDCCKGVVDSLNPVQLASTTEAVGVLRGSHPPSYPPPCLDTLSPSAQLLTAQVEVDFGVDEQVSNVELHALELDYQQEQFEQVQLERRHFPIKQWSEPVVESMPSTMEESYKEATLAKKRSQITKLVGSKERGNGKEGSAPHSQSSPSTPIVAASSQVKMGAITSSGSRKSGARRNSISLSNLPVHTIINREAAAKITRAVMGEKAGRRALEEFDFSIEMFDETTSIACSSQEARRKTLEMKVKEVQTMGEAERVEQGVMTEVVETSGGTHLDAQTQVEEESRLRLPPQVLPFDEAPTLRNSFVCHRQRSLFHLDFSHTLQPIKEEFSRGKECCSAEKEGQAAINKESPIEEKAVSGQHAGKMPHCSEAPACLDLAVHGPWKGYVPELDRPTDCREVGQSGTSQCFPMSPSLVQSEAEAAAALESLHAVAGPRQASTSAPTLDTEDGKEHPAVETDLEGADVVLSSNGEEAGEDESQTAGAQQGAPMSAATEEVQPDSQKRKRKREDGQGAKDLGLGRASTTSPKELKGKKKSAKKKMETSEGERERLRVREAQYNPPRRTSRVKQEVDYSDTARPRGKEVAEQGKKTEEVKLKGKPGKRAAETSISTKSTSKRSKKAK